MRDSNLQPYGIGVSMKLRLTKPLGPWVVLLALLVAGDAGAQDERALARAQQMLRQLSAEKTQLQQEVTQLRQEYADYRGKMEKTLVGAEAENRKLSEAIANLTRGGKAADRELDAARTSLQREQGQLAEVQNQLQVQTDNLEVCRQSNAALADTAYELIGLYQDKGFVDVLSKREPVTGIAKVKVESIVQSFEDRVMETQLEHNPQKLRDVNTGKSAREVAGDAVEE